MNQQPFPHDPTPLAVAAKRLGIHHCTLTRWIKAGLVPAWRVGPVSWGRKRRLVVSLSQLLARTVEPLVVNRSHGERCKVRQSG